MMFTEQDEVWMQRALQLAEQAAQVGEVPVGAVLVLDNEMIGEGFNQPIASHDPSAHAEIVAMRKAAEKVQNYRLVNSTLYVTLEPCIMCAGAMVHARIKRLAFGAYDPKSGAVSSQANILDQTFLNHRIEYTGGLLNHTCSEILTRFFRARRTAL